jgi:hypothetical protein
MIIEYHLTCERCASSYVTTQPDARFCSKICQMLAGPQPKKHEVIAIVNPCRTRYGLMDVAHGLVNGKRK